MVDAAHPEKHTTPFVVRMPSDLHAALKAKAAEDERHIAATIRWLVRAYVNGWNPPEVVTLKPGTHTLYFAADDAAELSWPEG